MGVGAWSLAGGLGHAEGKGVELALVLLDELLLLLLLSRSGWGGGGPPVARMPVVVGLDAVGGLGVVGGPGGGGRLGVVVGLAGVVCLVFGVGCRVVVSAGVCWRHCWASDAAQEARCSPK